MAITGRLSAAQVTAIRALTRDTSRRDAEQAFVLEGVKPLRELLAGQSPLLIRVVVADDFRDAASPDVQTLLRSTAVPVFTCPRRLFERLTTVVTPQGILAVVRQPSWDERAVLARPRLVGVCGEGIQDPANAGAIVRTAAAFGVDALWLSGPSIDLYNPKLVRAAAGTLLQLPVFRIPDATVLTAHGCELITLEPAGPGTKSIHELRALPPRCVICVGNEGSGLSDAMQWNAVHRVHIPIQTTVESLNVAAATAVGLFYCRSLPPASPSSAAAP